MLYQLVIADIKQSSLCHGVGKFKAHVLYFLIQKIHFIQDLS